MDIPSIEFGHFSADAALVDVVVVGFDDRPIAHRNNAKAPKFSGTRYPVE